jgi:hypothetical protein
MGGSIPKNLRCKTFKRAHTMLSRICDILTRETLIATDCGLIGDFMKVNPKDFNEDGKQLVKAAADTAA